MYLPFTVALNCFIKYLKATKNTHMKSLLPTCQLHYTPLLCVYVERGQLNIHPNWVYKLLSEISCKGNMAVPSAHHISAHEEVRYYHHCLCSVLFLPLSFWGSTIMSFECTEPEQFEMEWQISILVLTYLSQKAYYSPFTIPSKPTSLLLSKKAPKLLVQPALYK